MAQQLPIPPELVPQGGELTPTRMAYMDGFELPVINAAPEENGQQPHIVVVRANHLFELEPADVQLMARHGWRFWARHALVTGGVYLVIEPAIPLVQSHPWLNSDYDNPGIPRPDSD